MLGYAGSLEGGASWAGAEEKPNPANSPGGADVGAYVGSYATVPAGLIPDRLNPEEPAILGYTSAGFSWLTPPDWSVWGLYGGTFGGYSGGASGSSFFAAPNIPDTNPLIVG